jgi:hypothetical protein
MHGQGRDIVSRQKHVDPFEHAQRREHDESEAQENHHVREQVQPSSTTVREFLDGRHWHLRDDSLQMKFRQLRADVPSLVLYQIDRAPKTRCQRRVESVHDGGDAIGRTLRLSALPPPSSDDDDRMTAE